jgi:hypothetical protein
MTVFQAFLGSYFEQLVSNQLVCLLDQAFTDICVFSVPLIRVLGAYLADVLKMNEGPKDYTYLYLSTFLSISFLNTLLLLS